MKRVIITLVIMVCLIGPVAAATLHTQQRCANNYFVSVCSKATYRNYAKSGVRVTSIKNNKKASNLHVVIRNHQGKILRVYNRAHLSKNTSWYINAVTPRPRGLYVTYRFKANITALPDFYVIEHFHVRHR